MKKYGRERLKRIFAKIEAPKNTKFKGYVLHLPESDEFLALVDHNYSHTMSNYGWCKSPGDAVVFKKHLKAVRELQEYDKNNIKLCLLFDTGDQYFVLEEAGALDILGLLPQ